MPANTDAPVGIATETIPTAFRPGQAVWVLTDVRLPGVLERRRADGLWWVRVPWSKGPLPLAEAHLEAREQAEAAQRAREGEA